MSNLNHALVHALNDVLPQTQCQRCGFSGCLPYAEAMAAGEAAPNRCPPGGPPGLAQLSTLLKLDLNPTLHTVDPVYGEPMPLRIAFILSNACIGCTKCIDVCPTDAIVGAPKKLHVVIGSACTGCDLCLPPCPVDCIEMRVVDNSADSQEPSLMSWQQWRPEQINRAKTRYEKKQQRIHQAKLQPELTAHAAYSAQPELAIDHVLETALDRARNKAKARLGAIAKKSAEH
jgi:Na+-translocating ferredoxin:NAD+ oxidoreductase subunit B